ncbi:MAG: lipid exporter, fused ATPase and inner rane subunit MsbA [Firmicutes bacterium]|nr:lipid exporter, fused ATPase and inner rane subunit MsbA [Bacillota bacterium]
MTSMMIYMRLLRYLKPYVPQTFMAVGCMLLGTAASLYVPWIVRDVIDGVLVNKDIMLLNTITAGIVVVFALRGFFVYGQTYLMSYISQKIVIDLREALFRHFQRLSVSYFDHSRTGKVLSYMTNDVGALQGALAQNVIELSTESLTLVGSLVAMFYLHWQLALLTLVTVPLVAQAIKIFGVKLRKASGTMQQRAAEITSVLQEMIVSIRLIRLFVREDYEIDRFNRENENNFNAQMKAAQLSATLTPVVEFLAAIAVTIIVWYGGREVIGGNLTSGSLIAFLVYAVNISNPVKRLGNVYGSIQRAVAAAERVFDVLDISPEIQDAPDAIDLDPVQGQVAFKDVTFEYRTGEPALRNMSIDIPPGQVLAIVGPSGAGKSTIANLLPRFYDPQEGAIFIDGVDIKKVTVRSLREQIAMVPQETILFSASVYENILYGRLDATREEVMEAARASNAHDFILQLPEGYDTQIGERGCQLSGGQRQRISIARAILKDPRILILDEATSALDAESERLVQDALDKLMVGRTTLVIAHRLSTIQRADSIVVLDKGRMIECGRHAELLDAGGLYSKLYSLQTEESS